MLSQEMQLQGDIFSGSHLGQVSHKWHSLACKLFTHRDTLENVLFSCSSGPLNIFSFKTLWVKLSLAVQLNEHIDMATCLQTSNQ